MSFVTVALVLLSMLVGDVSGDCTHIGMTVQTGEKVSRDRRTDQFLMECTCGADGSWTCQVAPGGFRCHAVDGIHMAGETWTLMNPMNWEPMGECTCPMEPVDSWTQDEYCTKTCVNDWVTIEPGMTYVQQKYQTCVCGDDGRSTCTDWVNPCESWPCQHNGTCRDESYEMMEAQEAKYSCTCVPPYYGDNCELGSNPCESSPCQNGGSCTAFEEGYVMCECPLTHMGEMCEIPRSCADKCGAPGDREGTCTCDELCEAVGDCCHDYSQQCSGRGRCNVGD